MTETAPRRWPWFRRVVLPLGLIAVPVGAHLLPVVWQVADLDPAPVGKMQMMAMNFTSIALVLLVLWFLFLSGFSSRTKFAGLGVVALLAGGVVAAVAEWDLTGSVFPFPRRYRWEKSFEQELAEHRAGQERKDGHTDLTVRAGDHPRFRGPKLDGVVRGLYLANDWNSNPPREVWRQPIGGGFAGFAVAGEGAVTIEERDKQEVIVCYDRATGRERWQCAYKGKTFVHITGDGPRATPTIADGKVYSLGATGELVCVDESGKFVWQTNVLKEGELVTWAMAGSPLVTEKLVIVNAGSRTQSLSAYRRTDGSWLWSSGAYAAGYSSPQLATLGGVEQVLRFDAGGLAGFDLATGTELWRHEWTTFYDMNIIQPLVFAGDRVFISSETTNGGAMLRIVRKGDRWDVEVVWENKVLASKFSNPVTDGRHIYGLSNGWLVCLDVEDGTRRWRGRNYNQGQVLLVGGHLLVFGERGEMALVEATPEAYRELGRVQVFRETKNWNTPALAGGRLYLRNERTMVCYELPLGEW